jgi:outer membrane protein OmpA-like peptidoglycan-associated protein
MRHRLWRDVRVWLGFWPVCVWSLGFVQPVAAQHDSPPLRVRASGGAAMMLSADQLGRLGYDAPGAVCDLQLGYALLPWLDAQVAFNGGAFRSSATTGGLLAPLLGAALSLPSRSLRPYVQFDVGPGFSGGFTRPLLRAGVGIDIRITQALMLGPILGYGQLFQVNTPGASTDARFLWFGLVTTFAPDSSSNASGNVGHALVRREITSSHELTLESNEANEPTEPIEPTSAPSPELLALIEGAVPSARIELLAPVLFRVNAAELEPIGIAMLHEVARELGHRPDIRLLEIEGYADQRGDAEHNLALSQRRAATVLEWLVAHGVARARLRLAPHGASDLVEPGNSDSEHEQNRRVVFRVIEQAKP